MKSAQTRAAAEENAMSKFTRPLPAGTEFGPNLRLLSASELAGISGGQSATQASSDAQLFANNTHTNDAGFVSSSDPNWEPATGYYDGTGNYTVYHNTQTGDWGWGVEPSQTYT